MQKKAAAKKKTIPTKANNGNVIELDGVWKTYRMGDVRFHALRGATLRVKRGEFLAVMGPSGSGKSTLMNMIGCLDVPSKGVVHLNGKNIAKMTESGLAQIRGRTIGFIFQQFNLINSLTAKENVMLPLTFQGYSGGKREKLAESYLSLVGLSDKYQNKPTQLSGGQQQRVAIARALAGDPEVILADEPTGNLDSKSGETVLDFLKKLHKEKGTTIVLVTHDERVAKQANRLIYIKDGMIVKSLDEDTSKYLSEN